MSDPCEDISLSTHKHTWKISNPAISRIPMKEAPCLCLRSRALLTLCTSHLNKRSYVAFPKASTAKSACKKKYQCFPLIT